MKKSATTGKSISATAIVSLAVLVSVCLARGAVTQQNQPSAGEKNSSGNKLQHVRVVSLYENVTDGIAMGRSLDETVRILKATRTDLVFRGFFRWTPVYDSPDNIPPEFVELEGGGKLTARQVAENVGRGGHYYRELEKSVSAIKKALPDLIIIGAIAAQRINRVELNELTGHAVSGDALQKMVLDPKKWKIRLISRDEMQKALKKVLAGDGAYPDITNPEFQELLLSWAKKQIDCGVDGVWIDGLHAQEAAFYMMTHNFRHPAVKESYEASAKIIDEIHDYGKSKGRQVFVGTWSLTYAGFVEMPFRPPAADFITVAPSINEIEDKKPDPERWEKELAGIRKIYGDIPVLALIDWAFDESQLVSFSQKLAPAEQSELLKTFDVFFRVRGVTLVYPVHGGWMGAGEITKRLSFGKFRIYDGLAPEFGTFETIKQLALKKTGEKSF